MQGSAPEVVLHEVGQLYAQWQTDNFGEASVDHLEFGFSHQPASQEQSSLEATSDLMSNVQQTDSGTRAGTSSGPDGVSKLGKRRRPQVCFLCFLFLPLTHQRCVKNLSLSLSCTNHSITLSSLIQRSSTRCSHMFGETSVIFWHVLTNDGKACKAVMHAP